MEEKRIDNKKEREMSPGQAPVSHRLVSNLEFQDGGTLAWLIFIDSGPLGSSLWEQFDAHQPGANSMILAEL